MDRKIPRYREQSEAAVSDVGEDNSCSGVSEATSKRERFRRLAESRANKALLAIGIIGNLSNKNVYEYEDAEVKKILKALREKISDVEERFRTPKARTGDRFKLDTSRNPLVTLTAG